jgi:hypothetical protein
MRQFVEEVDLVEQVHGRAGHINYVVGLHDHDHDRDERREAAFKGGL